MANKKWRAFSDMKNINLVHTVTIWALSKLVDILGPFPVESFPFSRATTHVA